MTWSVSIAICGTLPLLLYHSFLISKGITTLEHCSMCASSCFDARVYSTFRTFAFLTSVLLPRVVTLRIRPPSTSFSCCLAHSLSFLWIPFCSSSLPGSACSLVLLPLVFSLFLVLLPLRSPCYIEGSSCSPFIIFFCLLSVPC